jgi:hypothetical protein
MHEGKVMLITTSSPVVSMMRRGTIEKGRNSYYVGVYQSELFFYDFFVGERSNLRERINNRHRNLLIPLKRIPEMWQKDMDLFMNGEITKQLGYIDYVLVSEYGACTFRYFPRKYLGKGLASGIPYFLEAMTTHHLKNRKFTRISTADITSDNRIDQLKTVGLPTHELTDINEWLKGMGRGIRSKIYGYELLANMTN